MAFSRHRSWPVFSGLALRPYRSLETWPGALITLLLFLIFPRKNTSLARILHWPAAGAAPVGIHPAGIYPAIRDCESGMVRIRSSTVLQERLAALPAPEFGTMTAREFFLYKSQLSPRGSIYTQIARFSLT